MYEEPPEQETLYEEPPMVGPLQWSVVVRRPCYQKHPPQPYHLWDA